MLSIVARNTKSIIMAKGLKQCVVAKKAGYKAKDFSAMLCGRKIIRDNDVWNISQALEVTPNDLFNIDVKK